MPDSQPVTHLQPLIEEAVAEEPWKGPNYSVIRAFSRNLLPIYGLFLLPWFHHYGYIYFGWAEALATFYIQHRFINPRFDTFEKIGSLETSDDAIPFLSRLKTISIRKLAPYLVSYTLLVMGILLPTVASGSRPLSLVIITATLMGMLVYSLNANLKKRRYYFSIKKRIAAHEYSTDTPRDSYWSAGHSFVWLGLLSALFRCINSKEEGEYIGILLYQIMYVFGFFAFSCAVFVPGSPHGLNDVFIFLFLMPTMSFCLYLIVYIQLHGFKEYQYNCIALRVQQKLNDR